MSSGGNSFLSFDRRTLAESSLRSKRSAEAHCCLLAARYRNRKSNKGYQQHLSVRPCECNPGLGMGPGEVDQYLLECRQFACSHRRVSLESKRAGDHTGATKQPCPSEKSPDS